MKTVDLFQHKTVLSFEVFPPKRTDAIETIYQTLDQLKLLNPDFVSVTYGAGGSANSSKTLNIAADIKNSLGMESVAHLPGMHLKKSDVIDLLDRFKQSGIENILALRGDRNPMETSCGDFQYASDLISFIREHGDFNLIAACYPEGHPECRTVAEDLHNLKHKVDAGANQLVTQLFFDNNSFYTFRERAEIVGINVPIEAGIMPVVNRKQIERMVTLCGVKLPKKFLKVMERYEHNPEAMRDAGIAYAIDQIVDLIAQGVDGIHLYTMNNAYIAGRIYEAINRLLVA